MPFTYMVRHCCLISSLYPRFEYDSINWRSALLAPCWSIAIDTDVVLFTTTMPVLTDMVGCTIWTVHPLIMQRQSFNYALAIKGFKSHSYITRHGLGSAKCPTAIPTNWCHYCRCPRPRLDTYKHGV